MGGVGDSPNGRCGKPAEDAPEGRVMSRHRTTTTGIAYEVGGDGPRLLLLVHGLGANASVWRPMLKHFANDAAAWDGRWAAPDLRGHGRSVSTGPFSYGVHVADLAAVIADFGSDDVTVIGHSFGGVLGAVLAGDLFGAPIRTVLAVGVKLDWTADELAGAQRIAQRGRAVFDSSAAAAEYALKLAGLRGLADLTDPCADIISVGGGFSAAVNPRVFSVVGPDIRALLSSCRAPLHLAAGSTDPMVSLTAMREVDRDARVLDDAGHNAHWENPAQLWNLVRDLTSTAAPDGAAAVS